MLKRGSTVLKFMTCLVASLIIIANLRLDDFFSFPPPIKGIPAEKAVFLVKKSEATTQKSGVNFRFDISEKAHILSFSPFLPVFFTHFQTPSHAHAYAYLRKCVTCKFHFFRILFRHYIASNAP